MFTYDYHRPKSKIEVCELLKQYGTNAKLLAGGTDLVVQMFEKSPRLKNISHVIDLTHIPELRFIKEENDVIRIGATTTHTDVVESEVLQKYVPFLCDATFLIGSPKIRNTGTIGGNIANASPAADSVVPLIALDARVKILGLHGERDELLVDIIEKPYVIRTDLDEYITEIYFNKLPETGNTCFVKLGRRKAMAISRLTVGVTMEYNQVIEKVSIVPGCIFPVPKRISKAEQLLIGKEPTEELIASAAKVVSEMMIEETGTRWSTPYKQPVIQTLVKRALYGALGWDEKVNEWKRYN